MTSFAWCARYRPDGASGSGWKDKQDDIYSDRAYCLNADGSIRANHPYFTQVQWQEYVLDVEICDFVLWTPNFMLVVGVPRDHDGEVVRVQKCLKMFRQVILPEILTRRLEDPTDTPSLPGTSSSANSTEKLYCYCQQPDNGTTMLGCDNNGCEYEWFHLSCLKRKRVPPPHVNWYCKECKNVGKENGAPKKGKAKKH